MRGVGVGREVSVSVRGIAAALPKRYHRDLGQQTKVAERGFDPRTFGLWAQHANHCATPLDVQTQMRDDSFLIVPLPAYAISCCMRASGVVRARGCTVQCDSEGIRTPAGRAQWISSPSP